MIHCWARSHSSSQLNILQCIYTHLNTTTPVFCISSNNSIHVNNPIIPVICRVLSSLHLATLSIISQLLSWFWPFYFLHIFAPLFFLYCSVCLNFWPLPDHDFAWWLGYEQRLSSHLHPHASVPWLNMGANSDLLYTVW